MKLFKISIPVILLFFLCSFQVNAKVIDTEDVISLWVGDSRTVLIYQDLNMKSKKGISYRSKARVEGRFLMLKYRDCYAGRGTGYDFVRKGIPKVRKTIRKKGRQNVIFSSGVNDIYNPSVHPFSSTISPESLAVKYWELYKNQCIKKYPEDHFYIQSINPIYKPLYYRGHSVTNEKIKRFNKKMKSLIKHSKYKNVRYIDTYKNIFVKEKLITKKKTYRYALKYRKMKVRYMRESSSFQLHYSTKVDKKIYRYVNQFIQYDR